MHRTSAKTTDNAQQWSVTTTDQAHPAHAKWLAQDTSTASTDTNAMRSYKMSSNNGKRHKMSSTATEASANGCASLEAT